jgi:hypothetical protein
VHIHSIEKPDLPPFEMPQQFRQQIAYFMTPSGEHGAPQLGDNEYWIRLADAKAWLDELVVRVVSPLDAEAKAEIELTDEQEAWLQWMVDNDIQHVRIER